MRICRYFGSSCLIFMLIISAPAYSGMPAYNGKFGVAVGGVIQTKIVQRGFAANDPRIPTTIGAVGAGLTTSAGDAAIALGSIALSSVSWPAILVAGGVTLAVVSGVILVSRGDIDWLWGEDYKAQVSGARLGETTYSGSSVVHGEPGSYSQLADRSPGIVNFIYPNGQISRFNIIKVPCGLPCISYRHPEEYSGVMDVGFGAAYTGPLDGSQPYWSEGYWDFESSSSNPETNGFFRLVYQYVPSQANPLTEADLSTEIVPYDPRMKLFPELYEDLHPVKNEEISDKFLADAANLAWQRASPDALPWSPTNPITPYDVGQWKLANPNLVPTVEDFFAPATQDNDVVLYPTSQTNPQTQGAGQVVDLGVDPNTPAPILEDIPTAQMILAPILSLMPELRNFSVPSHVSVCPQPSFALFEKTYVLDTHCILLEENRSIINSFMILSWSLMSILIILRA